MNRRKKVAKGCGDVRDDNNRQEYKKVNQKSEKAVATTKWKRMCNCVRS